MDSLLFSMEEFLNVVNYYRKYRYEVEGLVNPNTEISDKDLGFPSNMYLNREDIGKDINVGNMSIYVINFRLSELVPINYLLVGRKATPFSIDVDYTLLYIAKGEFDGKR
jgi:hypothetical protein